MPGPYVDPFHGDAELPDKVDVVVIGGGIVGTSTALELAERGVSVALCEKGGIAKEQSSRNWGWVRISRRDPREVPLMAEALRIWRGLDARVGRPTGYKRAGIIFACKDDRDYARHERWCRHLEGYQIEHRMLSAAELGDLVPGLRLDVQGRALHPRRRPGRAAEGRPRHRRAGARARRPRADRMRRARHRDQRGPHQRGRDRARSHRLSAVVLAGGAWSSLFAGRFGIDSPSSR